MSYLHLNRKLLLNISELYNVLTSLRPSSKCEAVSETATLTEMDEMRLRIFERQILRKIFGAIQFGKDIWRIYIYESECVCVCVCLYVED
jgi:hypothetical protein